MRTHVDEATVVVERSEVRTRQTEECVEFVDERRHLGSGERSTNDERAKRMTHKAAQYKQQVVMLKVMKRS